MKFASPQWFWALLALPPLLWLLLLDGRKRDERFGRFVDRALWGALAPDLDPKARPRKAAAWVGALAFALLALARPQWGAHEETVKASGLDVMMALDVSNSMETEDVVPSRIKKARHLARSLVDRLQGDRVGVVAFAASAYVACPLTTDTAYFLEVLGILGPRTVSGQGTDIGLGLDTARKALDRGAQESSGPSGGGGAPEAAPPQPSRVVVLISDGEDQEQGALEAAKALRESGIKLYVLGIGTEKGGPVPVRDEQGNLIAYKKDRKGQPVVSSFRPDALMQVAEAGGGRYFNVTSEELEVEEILQDMGALNRTEYAERKYLVHEERFQYPLALAVLLLFVEISLPARRLRRKGTAATIALALGALAVPLAASRPAHAVSSVEAYLENEKGLRAFREKQVEEAQRKFGKAQALDPRSPELQYNQGVAQLAQGDVESAIHGFREAGKSALKSGDKRLAAKSLYNLGSALEKKGDVRGAAQAYLSAIESSRDSKEGELEGSARKNLELLIQNRQKQKQEQKQKQRQQDEQKQGTGQQSQPDRKNESGKSSNDGEQKPSPEKKPGEKPEEQKDKQASGGEEREKKYEEPSESRKRGFKSQKLTPEDAERVMSELSNRERELQTRLKRQNGNAQSQGNLKDW